MDRTGSSFEAIGVVEPTARLVMVIEQSEEMLELFEQILSDEGYKLSLHYHGQKTLQEVKRIKPDLIITDYSFTNELLEAQFLQEMKMDKQTQNIPLVACTTNMTILRDAEERLFNMDIRVLSKPFHIDALFTLIRELLA